MVTRWKEKRDQRKVAFEWLRVEAERNLEKLKNYRDKEAEWRGCQQIYFPPFHKEAYQALIQRGSPFDLQDRGTLKLSASFYDRLGMIEFLVQRFNEREPGGKQESLNNLMKAIKAAQQDGESLLEALEKRGIKGESLGAP